MRLHNIADWNNWYAVHGHSQRFTDLNLDFSFSQSTYLVATPLDQCFGVVSSREAIGSVGCLFSTNRTESGRGNGDSLGSSTVLCHGRQPTARNARLSSDNTGLISS